MSLPSLHFRDVIFALAFASFIPITFGTTQGGFRGGGGGSAAPPATLPHQVLQRPEPSPAPAGAPAYSWTVQIDVSSDGSTCVLL